MLKMRARVVKCIAEGDGHFEKKSSDQKSDKMFADILKGSWSNKLHQIVTEQCNWICQKNPNGFPTNQTYICHC